MRAAERLACRSANLDGEVIVQDEAGRCNFAGLRSAIAGRPGDLVFMAFDLLHMGGCDLRKRPIEERRGALETLLGDLDPAQPIHFSAAFGGEARSCSPPPTRWGLRDRQQKARAQIRQWARQRLAEDQDLRATRLLGGWH